MGRKNLARHCIYWYDSYSCERDREDPYEDLLQSKVKKKLYKDIHK